MKTFTFTIELSESEITNTFNYLVAKGLVSSDTPSDEAVYNYAKALQGVMYTEMASSVLAWATAQALALNTPEVTPKDIGGGIA